MSEGRGEDGGPTALAKALRAWGARGDASGLARWLGRELDGEGVPRRLPVGAWGPCLEALAEARAARPSGWPEEGDARIEGLLRAALRFGRPDGSSIFGPSGPDPGRLASLRDWAGLLSDPTLSAVVRRWAPPSRRPKEAPGVPFLPAHACPDRPLAILRADWSPEGDWLAIDHRHRGGPGLAELAAWGRPWLGPRWSSGAEDGGGAIGPARPTFWRTGPEADLAEWTFRTRTARVVRTALLLRGRGLALLADEVRGREPFAEMALARAPGVEAVPVPGNRAIALRGGRGRSARVLPIGLPAGPDPDDRGALSEADGAIVLRQRVEGGRGWLPLIVSWRPDRDRRPTTWRPLTVSEQSRACPPGVAFAARVAWGAGEGLVVYRSLGRPALRAFLGHQTRARFLVGLFTPEGDIRPLIRVES